jgi:hypothetical protein
VGRGMSAAIVLLRQGGPRRPLQSLVADAGATMRHARARFRAVATSPTVLGLVLFGGLTVVPLWWSMSRWSVALAWDWAPDLLLMRIPDVLAMFLWVPLVVAAASGAGLGTPSRASATGRPAPALPIGPRSRAAADTLVVLVLVVAARAIGLACGLDFGPSVMSPLLETWCGLALVFPLVISWAAVPRFHGPGLLGPAFVMCVLLLVTLFAGGLSFLVAATAASAALSALLLLAAGMEVQVEDRRAAVARASLSFRVSPGPLARLRRDRWTGPLERQGALTGTLLLLVVIVEVQSRLMETPWRVLEVWLALLGLVALTMVVFHPFGLSVASSSGPGLGAFWNGYFGRAWSVLPVPPKTVARSVYAHGWIVGTVLWLLFCGLVWSTVGFDGRLGVVLVAFEAAGVPLAAGVLLCAAVGDGRRGTLALYALVAFQAVVPVGFPLARDLGLDLFRAPEHRAVASLATAWLLVLLGGLPPLVHLRNDRRRHAAS